MRYSGHHIKVLLNGKPFSRMKVEGNEPGPREMALNLEAHVPVGSVIKIVDEGSRRPTSYSFVSGKHAGLPSVTSAKKSPSRRDPERAGPWGNQPGWWSEPRKIHSEQWGHSSPAKVEDLLIEVSQRVQQADSALSEVLPQTRLPDVRGQRQRVKNNIIYLQRLIKEMEKYIDKANQAIGF
jgi:hypothetical protein